MMALEAEAQEEEEVDTEVEVGTMTKETLGEAAEVEEVAEEATTIETMVVMDREVVATRIEEMIIEIKTTTTAGVAEATIPTITNNQITTMIVATQLASLREEEEEVTSETRHLLTRATML